MNLNSLRKYLRRALALTAALALAAISGLSAAETVLATRDAEIYASPSANAPSLRIPAGTVMEKTGEKNKKTCYYPDHLRNGKRGHEHFDRGV